MSGKRTQTAVAPPRIHTLTPGDGQCRSSGSPGDPGGRSPASKPRTPGRRAWQQQALARTQLLRGQWVLADALATNDERASRSLVVPEFVALLDDAEAACDEASRSPLAIATGVNVERVWADVHAAEVLLVESLPAGAVEGYRDWVVDQVRTGLPQDTVLVRRLSSSSGPPLTGRRLAAALRRAYSSSAADHVRVRSFRNIIYFASLVTLAAVAVLVVIGWRVPTALPMCDPTAKVCILVGSAAPGADHVLVAAVIGAAAGVLAGVASLSRVRGSSVPYALAFALGLFKAPCGALSAVLGLLLVRAVVGGADLGTGTSAGIVGWVVVLGASQQLVTRLADQKGQTVLDHVRSGAGSRAGGKAGDREDEEN